jgi:hypothetical protein
MLLPLLLSATELAHADGCAKTSISELTTPAGPRVLVLGERKGTLPDVARAASIVKKLAAKGPVTVALQAVRPDRQAELDQWKAGSIPAASLSVQLDWSGGPDNLYAGFPFEAYLKLFETRALGVKFVGIAQPYSLLPEGGTVQLPPGYIGVLADAMGDGPVPVDLETTTVETVSWADFRLASAAVDGWDRQGTLVVLVDRYHVEGGLGVQWQLQRLVEVPVDAALLANGETRCYAGDRLLP